MVSGPGPHSGSRSGSGSGSGSGGRLDWLIVGLGNPGREHAHTRHNVGFMVADALAERWQLGRPRERYRGRFVEGRVAETPSAGLMPGGLGPDDGPGPGSRTDASSRNAPPRPRVAVLWPQTYMNEAGRAVGPARGALKLPLERVLVIHDEIDIPFGDIRARVGGGLAGHNGLKSLRRELGSTEFARVRVGVGRPPASDPETVSAYVLDRFREDPAQVRTLIEHAADRVQRVVLGQEPAAA